MEGRKSLGELDHERVSVVGRNVLRTSHTVVVSKIASMHIIMRNKS